jgi:Mycolic acid cyclopropane synthetase
MGAESKRAGGTRPLGPDPAARPRDLSDRTFDGICSIGAMEHFGSAELGRYFESMAAHLRPGGRMLNHCITRPSNREPQRSGAFIDRYVFPDGELQGPGTVIAAMHDHGLEIRHEENLREHYALTLREWGANLERHWLRAVAEVGERRARVWRLYMAYSRVGFDLDRIQIHQIVGVRLDGRSRSDMPLRHTWPGSSASKRPAASARPSLLPSGSDRGGGGRLIGVLGASALPTPADGRIPDAARLIAPTSQCGVARPAGADPTRISTDLVDAGRARSR